MSNDEIPEGFNMTELGALPEGWGAKTLVDIATLQRGKDLPKQNQIPGPYPIVGSSGIIGCHNRCVCAGPGVITGRSGSIGKLIYVEKDYWPHNTCLYVKDFHANNPKFIYYLLHLLDFKKYATGVSVPTLNRNSIHSALLPLPPLPEQHRIAAVLSAVQDAKENAGAVIAAAKSLKKSLMRHLFTYGPVSAGTAESVPLVETEIGLVPEGWEVVRLEKLTKRKATKGATPTTYGHNWVEEGILFLRSECIEENKLSLNGAMFISEEAHKSMERSKVYPGDILIRITGDVGIACVFPGDYEEANINQHISIVRLKQDTLINKDFLAYALNSPNQRKYFHSITGGITHPHLNLAQIRETPISIPPLPTQQKISHILSTVDKKIEAEENKKKALDELFKSLLHSLMTGKIRVNHLEAIP